MLSWSFGVEAMNEMNKFMDDDGVNYFFGNI